MDIEDLSWNKLLTNRFNSPMLPKSIKGIIIGKSGCGKTPFLFNLLLKPNWLDYDNLYIYGKSLFQPEYCVFKEALEKRLPKEHILSIFNNYEKILNSDIDVEDIIEKWSEGMEDDEKSETEIKFFETGEDVPNPRDLDKERKNLMIFDDLLLEKQRKRESYYTRGRHSNVDCFYLSQNYFEIPRRTIRESSNFICLFRQDGKNINHIYDDHVKFDMEKEEFRKLCRKTWEKPFGFVTVDLTSERDSGRYRRGLDEFFLPETLPV